MNKALTLIAAAATLLVANTALTPVAQAGGGVRLQFGFPLGSFTARPSGSSNSHTYTRRHDYAAARRAAARREAMAEAAAARRAKIAAAKAEARREAIAEAAAARRAKIAAAKAEARREAIAEAAAARRARIAAAQAKARIASQKQQLEEAPVAEVARTETETLAPNAAPLPEQKAKGDVFIGETNVVVDQVAEKQDAARKDVVAKADSGEPRKDCRRFVPSAGLTITVPCVQ